MMNMKILFKINIYLFFICNILMFSNLSYADNETNTAQPTLESTLNNTSHKVENSNVDKNLTKESDSLKDNVILAYKLNVPIFDPMEIPEMRSSKSKISPRVSQITDEITSLANTTQSLYDKTIESQDHNNHVYTEYRHIIDNLNATLDKGHSLPGDPELVHKITKAYQLLEDIKHTLATLQTLNMEIQQQASVNIFLISSIKRTKNIEVANSADKTNLNRLAVVIKHSSLYVKAFKKYFKTIMVKHQLLISKTTTEVSRVNAGIIAGKSVKIIFQEQQHAIGKINTKHKHKHKHR